MISLEQLEAFDHALWLGSGTAAGELLGCDQSTVSRQSAAVCRRLNLPRLAELRAGQPPPESSPNLELLRLERRVHQLYRLLHQQRLRLHAYLWSQRLLLQPLPLGWLTLPPGTDATRVSALQLLEERVIDAWMAPAPELPEELPPHLLALPLFGMPLHLLVHESSALARDHSPYLEDVAQRTHLGLLDFVPKRARSCTLHLDQHLFAATMAPDPEAITKGDRAPASHGIQPGPPQSRSRSRHYGTHLTTRLGPYWRVLPWELPVRYQEMLVVHADVVNHGPIQQLMEQLRCNLRTFLAQESVELLIQL